MDPIPRILRFPLAVCESCRGGPLEPFVIPGVVSMSRCPHCNLYQKGRTPDAGHYRLPYHAGYAAGRRRKLRTAVVRLSRIAGQVSVGTPRLLDVGCSLGYTVEAASALGWDAEGVDVSPDAIASCRKRGLSCRESGAEELPFPDESFDVVTAWHVLEHVADAARALAEWHRVVRPGGLLVLEVPDAESPKVLRRGTSYRRFWTPEHVYVFSPRNLVPLVDEAEFEVVRAPWLGRLDQLTTGMAMYSVASQMLRGLMKVAGLSKAFQLFCRRPERAAAPALPSLEAAPLRRVA